MLVARPHPLISEFYQRRRLKELGYTAPLEELDPTRLQAFELIAKTISAMPPKKGPSKPGRA